MVAQTCNNILGAVVVCFVMLTQTGQSHRQEASTEKMPVGKSVGIFLIKD